MIDLKFLGYGAAFCPKFGNTGAYFTIDDTIYFLDFGESVFKTVYEQLPLKRYSRVCILISHLHADHVGSLASMVSYMYYALHNKVTVVHPSDALVDLLSLEGTAKECYSFTHEFPQDGSLSVRFIPVEHEKSMECFGFLIETPDSTVYYSADATDIPPEILSDFLQGRIDRIYQDTASRDSTFHCGYKKLLQLVPEELRGKVFCMHLDGDYSDTLKNCGFSVVEPVRREKGETNSETRTKKQTETVTGTESDTKPVTGTESDTKSVTKSVTKTETDTKPEISIASVTDAEIEPETEPKTKPEIKPKTEIKSETPAAAEQPFTGQEAEQ